MLTQLGAAELAAKLRSREVGAREVAESHLARIESLDPDYSAFLTVCREQALAQADEAQAALDAGDAEPLCGIPIALKDNMCTRGIRTTAGSKILDTFVPPFDATVVERLKESKAIILGKTNLDEFAFGTSTENSAYFPTRNPWDPDLSPGGSSGGSAAAVAGEMAAVSLGSDTGGSIRQPAALSGVVGYKPTYGRVSRYGLIAFGSSLDQIGPFGRSVEDVSIVAQAISGPDRRDSTSQRIPAISAKDLKSGSLRGLKVALPKELRGDAIQEGVREAVDSAIDSLRREGVEFKEVSIPSIPLGVTTYYIIAPAEASSNLARFDGVRYGPRVDGEGHIGAISATRGQLFGHEVKLRLIVGTYALSAGYYDAYYNRALQVRALMTAEMERVFEEFDCVVSATSPCVAFPIGELSQDPMALKLLDLCTIPANLGGFPSISIPCGASDDLPVGLLMTGPINGDERLLQIAFSFEQALPYKYRRPPIP